MNTLKHKIERTAFAKAFDVAYDKMGKDRQHELKKMFDMAKPYIDQTDVAVSYTHLDVYKRQVKRTALRTILR